MPESAFSFFRHPSKKSLPFSPAKFYKFIFIFLHLLELKIYLYCFSLKPFESIFSLCSAQAISLKKICRFFCWQESSKGQYL